MGEYMYVCDMNKQTDRKTNTLIKCYLEFERAQSQNIKKYI